MAAIIRDSAWLQDADLVAQGRQAAPADFQRMRAVAQDRTHVAVAVAAVVVAAVLVPWLPPGLPVLAAAVVAIVVGVTNVLGRRTT